MPYRNVPNELNNKVIGKSSINDVVKFLVSIPLEDFKTANGRVDFLDGNREWINVGISINVGDINIVIFRFNKATGKKNTYLGYREVGRDDDYKNVPGVGLWNRYKLRRKLKAFLAIENRAKKIEQKKYYIRLAQENIEFRNKKLVEEQKTKKEFLDKVSNIKLLMLNK